VILTLSFLRATPSFWYLICGFLWAFSGVLWFIRPGIAAQFLIAPAFGTACLVFQFPPSFDPQYLFTALAVALAVGLIVACVSETVPRNIVPASISGILVLTGIAVDRAFTNQVTVRTYSMQWTADGVAPWGEVEKDARRNSPVVLYRKQGDSYCYDAVFSSELRNRLSQSKAPVIEVAYNLFRDFGKLRAYNIRSVGGWVFNDGRRIVHSGEGYGGQILNGSGSATDCH
jgi:hypothetical protein